MVYGYDQIEEVFRSFAKKGEKSYFICNSSNGCAYYIFKNSACPLLISDGGWDIYSSKESYQKQANIWEQNGKEASGAGQILSFEEWERQLWNCQYVFIFHPGDIFAEDYGSLFLEPETIDDGTFYRVIQSEGKIVLSYIGKIGVKDFK